MIPFMGFFLYDEEKDEVRPTQTKWVWEGPKGVEKLMPKKEKTLSKFLEVFVELTTNEYNDLWGKHLELL